MDKDLVDEEFHFKPGEVIYESGHVESASKIEALMEIHLNRSLKIIKTDEDESPITHHPTEICSFHLKFENLLTLGMAQRELWMLNNLHLFMCSKLTYGDELRNIFIPEASVCVHQAALRALDDIPGRVKILFHIQVDTTIKMNDQVEELVEEWWNETCSICSKRVVMEGVECTKMPCLHLFHHDCVFDWFEKAKKKNSCPTCQFEMPSS